MKTFFTVLTMCAALFLVSCESTDEPLTPQTKRAGKGSVFTYSRLDYDGDGMLFDSGTTTYTIDSANMSIDTKTDMMRAVSEDDTILFDYDASAMHVYRPAIDLFPGITLPATWQDIIVGTDTATLTRGTYTGQTQLNGATADVTINEREQYLGQSSVTVSGKVYSVIRKMYSTEVKVEIPSFSVSATTTVARIFAYAPDLGFIAASSDIRTTDSQFSPIPPGSSELTLKSFTM